MACLKPINNPNLLDLKYVVLEMGKLLGEGKQVTKFSSVMKTFLIQKY